MWIYIILIGILVIMTVTILCSKSEPFATGRLTADHPNILHPTVAGTTVTSRLVYNDIGYSTLVRKLLGDNGKTIILLHDNPFNMEMWDPMYLYIQSLQNSGQQIPTLLSYDLIGHGTSWEPVDKRYNTGDMNTMAWSLKDFSSQLFKLYKQYVEKGKVVLVGFGFGGTVAQQFTLEHPELIEHLYVLGTTIGKTINGLPDEKNYLVQWIAKHPLITYLTMEQKFVNWNLCLWLENDNPRVCSDPRNMLDRINSYDTIEYLIAKKMFTEASCNTYLQIVKILDTYDLRPQWQSTKVSSPITFLIGDRDHYTDNNTMIQDVNSIKGSSPSIKLYIVNGKHGFVFDSPEYIYKLISGQDMTKDPLTIEST